MKKLLLAATVLAVSASGAQAATLTYEGTHAAVNTIETYWVHVNSGDITMIMDTLSDGMDATWAIWQKVDGSFVAGQPEDSDWALVDVNYGATSSTDLSVPVNDFGVPLRNGYVGTASLVPTGTSDPGGVFSGLSGDYLITVNGVLNDPWGFLPGDLMSLGFQGVEELGEINTYPHNYKFTITGDVSEVSQVPVPAAVWLFGTALAGFGTLSRKKSLAA